MFKCQLNLGNNLICHPVLIRGKNQLQTKCREIFSPLASTFFLRFIWQVSGAWECCVSRHCTGKCTPQPAPPHASFLPALLQSSSSSFKGSATRKRIFAYLCIINSQCETRMELAQIWICEYVPALSLHFCFCSFDWVKQRYMYRDRLKSMQILLSKTLAGPGRAVKKEQVEISPKHVQAF